MMINKELKNKAIASPLTKNQTLFYWGDKEIYSHKTKEEILRELQTLKGERWKH